MNKNLSERIADWYSRNFPDALIFALVLTFLAILMAVVFTDSSTFQVLGYWFDGIPWLFTFAFQLMITYAAALVLVDTPVVKKFIGKTANLVKTANVAYAAVGIIGAITSFLGWYIGPVVTSIFARAIGQNVKGVDYRLLSAIAYSSFTISLTGISGSIPLFAATEGQFTELLGGLYPLDTTTFSTLNIVTAILVVVVTTIIFYFIGKNKKEIMTYHDLAIHSSKSRDQETKENSSVVPNTFADKINHSRSVIFIIGLLGLVYLIYFFIQKGINGLNLNSVAFIAIVLGFLVQKNSMTFADSFTRNLAATSGIAIQFPLYGGIASVLVASGLANDLTKMIVDVATESTFPVYTFLLTGAINMFIPSAGSMFTTTAPFLIPAAQELGVEMPRAILAITYGDIWTNLIQPFWCLLYFPILAVGTRLTVRDFMGYCFPILIAVGLIWGLGLVFLPL